MKLVTHVFVPIIVVVFLNTSLWMASAFCADKIITDIKGWQHPAKKVFQKYGIRVSKVELKEDGKYPIFYVKLPFDPQSSENEGYYNQLFFDLLRSNGWWNYSLDDAEDNLKISITWDRKRKIMNKEFIQKE